MIVFVKDLLAMLALGAFSLAALGWVDGLSRLV